MAEAAESTPQLESDYSSGEDDFREEFATSKIEGYRFEPVASGEHELSSSETDSDDSSDGESHHLEQVGGERMRNTNWCSCGECIVMDTELECVCCQEILSVREMLEPTDQICATYHPKFQTVCLDRDVLSVAALTVSYMTHSRLPKPITDVFYRLTSYRQFTLWTYGRLGRKNRHVIPACVVNRIRKTFPQLGEDQEAYRGFREAESD